MKRKTRGVAIAAALSRMRLNIAIFALFVVLAVVGGVALRDTLAARIEVRAIEEDGRA